MYIQSEEVKERKRQRKVETEVADLKLKLATTHSKNIVLSNREIRLLRYTAFRNPCQFLVSIKIIWTLNPTSELLNVSNTLALNSELVPLFSWLVAFKVLGSLTFSFGK